jgi:hypothetical protein
MNGNKPVNAYNSHKSKANMYVEGGIMHSKPHVFKGDLHEKGLTNSINAAHIGGGLPSLISVHGARIMNDNGLEDKSSSRANRRMNSNISIDNNASAKRRHFVSKSTAPPKLSQNITSSAMGQLL